MANTLAYPPDSGTLTVTFSGPLNDSTWNGADVTISGPQSATIGAPTPDRTNTYQLSVVPALTSDGNYVVSVGPNITGKNGFGFDQDRDGVGNETTQDVFSQPLVIDTRGPRVVSHTPSGISNGAVNHVDLTFSEPLDAFRFTPEDVGISGPNGAIQPLSVTRLTANIFRIGFPFQGTSGNYTVTIGTELSDLAGNPMNQDNDASNGEGPVDGYVAAFQVSLTLPRIVSHTPTGVVSEALDHFDVTFSSPILASAFTASDVRLLGPRGLVSVNSVTRVSDTVYRVNIDRITAEGNYSALIGPDIQDPGGNLMDQDRDNIAGEPDDRYEATFSINDVGPRVTAHAPNSLVKGPATFIDVTFSEPILLASFTTPDVQLTGPNGSVALSTITQVNEITYRIAFPAQNATGEYSFQFGPFITDLANVPMNQDGDAVDGESLEDAYSGTFSVDGDGPRVISSSPVSVTNQAVSFVAFEFSEPVVSSTLTLPDATLIGPSGSISITFMERLDATHFRAHFPTQTAEGAYQFRLGPMYPTRSEIS